MKDSVTRFNFDDAFKALDEIEIPVAEKGIRANRIDLKESMKRVDKFELLFEDFYDVNNADDMNAVSAEREAEVAKAKLARIEKIVDLDAETEDDILPSYVGKTIIQCPQCMTLFYKDAEDVVRDEENPDVVNVNEVCQHCGNESGYEVVGKVAEETEAAPGDELGTDDFSAEVGDGENDIAIDDGSETTEEAPAEEGGDVDELSAEADLDSLDLDTELDTETEEEPVEEESTEEVEESLKLTEKFKGHVENKEELKNELLRKIPESELWDDLGKKDELHCTLPGNNINVIKSKVESVLADSVLSAKVEVKKADMAEGDWIYVAITGIKEDTNAMQSFESLNNSKALKDAEEESDLKTENESKKLTLNEEVVEKETDQVCSVIANGKEDTEYFTGTEEECKAWIEEQNKTEAGKHKKWSVKKSAHVPVVETLELESSSKQLNDFATAIHKAFEAKNLSNIEVSTSAVKCKWGSGGHIMITSSDNETDRNAEILKQFALKALEKAGGKAEIAKIERANGATFIILDNILAAQQTAVAIKEGIEDNLDDKLKAHEDYIKYLRDTIDEEEKKLANAKNEQVKQAIQKSIDAHKEELEAALPDAVKAEVQEEELPDATEAGMEDATDNTTEEEVVEEKKTTESLHEGKFGRLEALSDDLAFLANEFDEALAATNDLSYDIEIKDDYIISVVSFDIKQVDDIAKKYFKKHDIVPVITEVSEFVHDYKLAPQDKVAEPAQEALDAEAQEEVKEQSDSLHEAVESMTDTLNRAWEFAKKTSSPIGVTVITPVGAGTVGKIKDWSRSVNANLYYVDAKNPDLMANGFDEDIISRPNTIIVIDEFDRAPTKTQKAISEEIDYLDARYLIDTQVEMAIVISHDSNLGSDNFKRFKQYVAVVENETNEGTVESTTENLQESVNDFKELLGSAEFKKSISENEVKAYYESISNDDENVQQQKEPEEKTDSESTSEIKAEVSMGTPITAEESESLGELTEANIFAKMWEKGKEWMQKIGMYDTMLAVAKVDRAYSLCSIPFLDPKSLGMRSASISDFPAYNSIQVLDIETFAKTYGIEGSDAAKKFKAAFAPQMTNFKKLVASNYRSDSYTTLAGGSPITDISAPIAEVWIILTKNVSKADLSDKSKLKALIKTAKTNLDSGATGKTDARIVGKYTSSGFDFKLKNVSGDAQGLMGQSIGDAAKNEVEAETKDTKKATLETIKAKYTGKFSLVYPITVDKTQWTCIKTAIEIDDLQKELTAAAETYTTSEIYGIADTVINTVGDFTLDEAGIAQVKNATLFKSKDHGAKVVSSIQNFYIAVNADNNFKESLQFEDIDEDSFTKQLTESLKDVYENVDSFTMTECASNNNKLIIEGLITFNSGKTKKTSYIFETCNIPDTELIMLEGINKDLFETGAIKITAKVLEESLHAQTLQYKYSIDKTLVEGIINN